MNYHCMLYSYRKNVKINKKTFQWPPLYVSTGGVPPQKGPEARHIPPRKRPGIRHTPRTDLGPGIHTLWKGPGTRHTPQKGPGARHTPLSSWTDRHL